jgi:hypothetical protein
MNSQPVAPQPVAPPVALPPLSKKLLLFLIVVFLIILGMYIIIPILLINYYNNLKKTQTLASYENSNLILAIVCLTMTFVCPIIGILLIISKIPNWVTSIIMVLCVFVHIGMTAAICIIINTLATDKKINENYKYIWIDFFLIVFIDCVIIKLLIDSAFAKK